MTFRRLDIVVTQMLLKHAARHIAQRDDEGPPHGAWSTALSASNLQPNQRPPGSCEPGSNDDGLGGAT